MPVGKKKSPRKPVTYVKIAGMVGDPTMEEVDEYNLNGAGVDVPTASKIRDVQSLNGDPNGDVEGKLGR